MPETVERDERGDAMRDNVNLTQLIISIFMGFSPMLIWFDVFIRDPLISIWYILIFGPIFTGVFYELIIPFILRNNSKR